MFGAVVFEQDNLRRFGYKQELRRSLSFPDLLFYGLIFMVPIAPFGIFGSVYQASGGMVTLAYGIGMVAMVFTAASYAQMVKAFPMAGSVYTYAGRGIAPPVGFVAGWMVLLDYILVPSLLYLVAGSAMTTFVPGVPVWAWLLIFLAFNTTVNFFGIKLTAVTTRVMLVGELAVLLIFLAVGIYGVATGKATGDPLKPLFDSHHFSTTVAFGAVSVAALSFLGFDGISMLAEENRGESRQVGRALIGALVLAGLLFMVQTWVASMFVSGPAQIKGDVDNAFYNAAKVAGGPWLSTLTALTTAIAWGFADSLVAQVATSRLLFAMGRDRQLPKFLARVSPKRMVPTNAIFLTALVTLGVGLYMSSRDDGIALLSSMINVGALAAFMLLHLSVVVYHLIRQRSRRVFAHLVVPVIGIAILVLVEVNADHNAQILGVAWLALGLIVLASLYALGRRPRVPSMGMAEDEPVQEPV
ncbi:APC family permease [Actinocatenispora comari]|uniref:Porin n=1 Tax=Actinocatenispora comari TaxID=2807577 RepID=A0A8J4AHE3_9ACTN|nr:APC family permease [Actinocatenispora comari]GIL30645.1 porin [Actinocatenispora comari]